MLIIIKRYIQDNWENIFFRIMIIIYLITFIISKNNNVLLIKIFTYVIDISIMITLLILCYYKKSEIKITIFIKDLIKSK
jgi:hypothetical protein